MSGLGNAQQIQTASTFSYSMEELVLMKDIGVLEERYAIQTYIETI